MFNHEWEITKCQGFSEAAIRKIEPKIMLWLLAALGIMLIGLTTTNSPVVYSQLSVYGDDGGDDSNDGGGDDSTDGGGDDSTDGGGDDSNDGGGDDSTDGGGDDSNDGGDDSTDRGKQEQTEVAEVCDDGIDNDNDDKVDTDDSNCKHGKSDENIETNYVPLVSEEVICDDGIDNDNDDKVDTADTDCELIALPGSANDYTPDYTPFSASDDTQQGDTSLDSESASDTKTFKNAPYGITTTYPSHWQIDETDSNLDDGLIEVAHIYPSSGTDEKVEIRIDDQTAFGPTLEGYLQSTTDTYKNNFGGITVLESDTNSTLAGNPAYRLVFTSNDRNTEIMETGFIDGGKVYYITYIAKPESYPSYLPDVQNIADSLSINR